MKYDNAKNLESILKSHFMLILEKVMLVLDQELEDYTKYLTRLMGRQDHDVFSDNDSDDLLESLENKLKGKISKNMIKADI